MFKVPPRHKGCISLPYDLFYNMLNLRPWSQLTQLATTIYGISPIIRSHLQEPYVEQSPKTVHESADRDCGIEVTQEFGYW